jgi:predicted  nucleic acid-binding Zn-ribbon protein
MLLTDRKHSKTLEKRVETLELSQSNVEIRVLDVESRVNKVESRMDSIELLVVEARKDIKQLRDNPSFLMKIAIICFLLWLIAISQTTFR